MFGSALISTWTYYAQTAVVPGRQMVIEGAEGIPHPHHEQNVEPPARDGR
jgi:hypothetical protein